MSVPEQSSLPYWASLTSIAPVKAEYVDKNRALNFAEIGLTLEVRTLGPSRRQGIL